MKPKVDWWLPACLLMVNLLLWQEVGKCSDAKNEVIYQTIAMEGANQSITGQALIGVTLLNRAAMRKTTPQIEALRPKQYSAWNDQERAFLWLSRHYTPKVRTRAIQAWNQALRSEKGPFLTHYHTLDVYPYWAKGKKPAIQEGSHVFYANIK